MTVEDLYAPEKEVLKDLKNWLEYYANMFAKTKREFYKKKTEEIADQMVRIELELSPGFAFDDLTTDGVSVKKVHDPSDLVSIDDLIKNDYDPNFIITNRKAYDDLLEQLKKEEDKDGLER